jgi:hypothetical protein
MNIGLSFVETAGKGLSGNSSSCGDPKEKGRVEGDGRKSPEDEAE